MAGIHALSRRYGFRIIEDASHAIGGRHLKDRIGAGRLSDITVFSFHAVKVITTGEGGMALTRDHTLAGTMRRLRSHGTTRNVEEMTHAPDGPWYYQQRELGFNYRMTDVQAALGTSQMGRLDAFLEKRRALARRYDAALTSLPLVGPWQHPDNDSAWHLYVVRVDQSRGRSRRVVFEALRAAGIGANVHYIPVHRQPYFEALGFRRGQFPAAEAYYEEAISLPLHPRLQEAQQDYIVATLGGAMC
jgi:dTDP-4-amino-4,6-dideoxygalactose transaminase